MSVCTSATRCTKTAVIRVRVGCVHEHVFTAIACSGHAAMIRKKKFGACGVCAQGAAAHKCKAVVLPPPAASTSTGATT